MKEVVEYILDQIYGAWRFRRLAVLIAWVACALGWLSVLAMPDTYEATARVFVDTHTRLSQVTQGIAVDSNIDPQIQRVRQVLFGGPQLEKVANDSFPAFASGSAQQRQAIISALRNRIQLTLTGQPQSNSTAGLYTISYTDDTRPATLKVVDSLLRSFMNNTIGGNQRGSQQAQRFLVAQIKEHESRLSIAESRLAEFKKQNVGLMPGQQGDYFAHLQAESDGLEKARASLAVAQQRREAVQHQLISEQPLLAGGQSAAGNSTTGIGIHAMDTGSRIQETQARLDELLLRFTDRHPDVIALRQTLADLKARQTNEIEEVRRGDPAAMAQMGVSANPVFQSIQLQLNQISVEIAALKGEIAERESKIANLRTLINTAPEVEAELARLNRDYDVTRAQYQALLERLERAKLSEEAEATGVVGLEIVEPPTASFAPIAPNRPRLIVMVLFIGLGAGVGIAYLMHQMRPVFNSERELRDATQLPVLGVVSMTWLDKHRALVRHGILGYASGVACLILLTGFVVVVQSRASVLVRNLL